MPVERVPGFWDYLNQGVDKGVQIGMEGVKHQREDARNKVTDAQQNAGVMAQLYGQGAVGNTALEGAMGAAGMAPPGGVMESKAQKRQKVLSMGQGAVDALSDEERKDLGFTTTLQRKTEASQGATADMELNKTQGLSKYLTGEKLSDQEYAAYGLPSPSDRELKKLTQMDPYLGELGGRYVAGQLVKNNGRIAEGTSQQVAEQAYADYVTERGKNGLGGLTPEQVTYTRQFFNRATQDALIAQHKMDIAEYEAKSGRIHANAAGQAAGQNTNIKWFGQMNNAMESLRKAQQDLTKANPMLSMALDNPQMASNPMVAGAVAKYTELQNTMEAFRGAQGALAEGQVPGNLSALLEAASQITTRGAGGAPPANAGGAAPTGAPPGSVRLGGGPPAAAPGGDAIATAVQMISSGQATLQQLQQAVSAGRLSKAQYDQIASQVSKTPKKK